MAYHEHTDHRYLRNLRTAAPDAVKSFLAFDQEVLNGASKVISRKNTELMAVAVALTTQCAYCIEAHVKAAKAEGASAEELAETVMIASALRAGGSFAHGFMAMKFFDGAPDAATADHAHAPAGVS
ncbi:possible carboxymuconolactone decarboxylase (plasmid) [Rhodococcus jostii RHA1]|uniref:Possible carboxymuconolactone decarboxylase n=1 Tax=Rhodococcus jostii (strain RHA1) TaxID=101510 RepID=Q0RX77_RHOJR|nr:MULTISPECIES: carboxymuconolactone decarboxylase family protein [Rhodococcus]ABH00109.1 possible carboxymuconolactone decarboxylase [Rhodococcus jostii RHA1]UZG60191.1 carboxymuconolactone decarboxylase family protein [Rhodococcus opacus]